MIAAVNSEGFLVPSSAACVGGGDGRNWGEGCGFSKEGGDGADWCGFAVFFDSGFGFEGASGFIGASDFDCGFVSDGGFGFDGGFGLDGGSDFDCDFDFDDGSGFDGGFGFDIGFDGGGGPCDGCCGATASSADRGSMVMFSLRVGAEPR